MRHGANDLQGEIRGVLACLGIALQTGGREFVFGGQHALPAHAHGLLNLVGRHAFTDQRRPVVDELARPLQQRSAVAFRGFARHVCRIVLRHALHHLCRALPQCAVHLFAQPTWPWQMLFRIDRLHGFLIGFVHKKRRKLLGPLPDDDALRSLGAAFMQRARLRGLQSIVGHGGVAGSGGNRPGRRGGLIVERGQFHTLGERVVA